MEACGFHHLSVANVFPLRVYNNRIHKQNMHLRVAGEFSKDLLQGVFKVLFIGVEVGAEIACRAGKTAVDSVIHSGIGLGEDFEGRIAADG